MNSIVSEYMPYEYKVNEYTLEAVHHIFTALHCHS